MAYFPHPMVRQFEICIEAVTVPSPTLWET